MKQAKINFPIKRIVDIGSGDAYVIHTLVNKGFAEEYIAIDTAYTSQVINQLKENNKSEVVYFAKLEVFNDLYDTNTPTLFLCMDVLEHLENEKIILDLLDKNLNNFYFLLFQLFNLCFLVNDVLLGHFRRYTLKQLNKLLIENQFTIIDKGYYFSSLLLFRNIDKILKKDKNVSIDNWEGSKIKTK